MFREKLVEAARAAINMAYAPYSKFQVGAAVLGESGRVYAGANVENASFGLTICAERVAVLKAISEGERTIKAVAVANSAGSRAFPCGACRQVIAEFVPTEGDVDVYLVSDEGVEAYTLANLLPHSFKL
ncbi:MAG: cytidine deaminase [Armatimonadetes bacterium]|nr:cytidine deaminase [Armatimonadota bacterium]